MVGSDEQAVKAAVEQFLEAAGSHDLDAVEEMVVSNANVGWASLLDGKWTTSTMSIEEWITQARAELNPTVYTEPVMDWTVHVDGSHLAFVRADANLFVGEKAERHNIDYFTLIKTNGVWKFLTLSYVGTPVESE
jgi:hypothetical protein